MKREKNEKIIYVNRINGLPFVCRAETKYRTAGMVQMEILTRA